MSNNVVTRFAPSPTGYLHIGGARTALFSYLYAKQHEGTYLLRIEDTDKERSKKEYEDAILESFAWLAIPSDKEPIRQSTRLSEHQQALTQLIADGHAYEAEASERGSGKVIRFKNPNKKITFTDLIRGEVTFDTTDLSDFVIARNSEEPLYHLAVVVDDGDMGVTHVVRGEEHISNTPRQILILEALGYERPVYAHLPLILAPDKSKLSKRHGDVSVHEYQKEGFLPDALVNYLALLGWHPKDDREVLSREELIKEFDLSRVQKGGAVFDIGKLRSINKKYLQKTDQDEFLKGIEKYVPETLFKALKAKESLLEALIPILKERIEIFSDIGKMVDDGEITYFIEQPQYKKDKLIWKTDTVNDARTYLEHVFNILNDTEQFTEKNIKESLWNYASEVGRGSVLWPLRYALSGRDTSPDPFVLASVLGKKVTLERIAYAIKLLS